MKRLKMNFKNIYELYKKLVIAWNKLQNQKK